MYRFYRQTGLCEETCFYVETEAELSVQDMATLQWLLSETFEPELLSQVPFCLPEHGQVVEVGPRLNHATPFSTNAVLICHACGLNKVIRLERSRRHLLSKAIGAHEQIRFLAANHDCMTEMPYVEPLETFANDQVPEPVFIVPVIEQGPDALRRINAEMGLGMDEVDIEFYTNMFVNTVGRNPTNVECFQLGQANSEHSRH